MNRNVKYKCGEVQPSGCVTFTGSFPGFIDEDSLPCNPNIDTLFELYGTEIDRLAAQLDLRALDKKCLDFDPETVSVHGLFQKHTDKICELNTALAALQTLVNSNNITQKQVSLDLKCMKPPVNICGLPTDTYTLGAVLNILVNEICKLKSS